MVDKKASLSVDSLVMNRNEIFRSSSNYEKLEAENTVYPNIIRLSTKSNSSKMFYVSLCDSVLYITSQVKVYEFSIQQKEDGKTTESGLEGLVLTNVPQSNKNVVAEHKKAIGEATKDELNPMQALELYREAVRTYLHDINPRRGHRRYTEGRKTTQKLDSTFDYDQIK